MDELSKEREARLLAEQALRACEERLRESQRIAHIGSWEWDIVGNHLYWSDEIYRIFGVSRDGFGATYEAFFGFVHPEDREFVKRAVSEALEGRPYSIEHRIVIAGPIERVVCERGQVFFDEDKRPLRMVGTVEDITERKKAEEKLIRAQKLEVVGELAAGIAHDFNNILHGIIGYASLASELVEKGSRMHVMLREIEGAATRARKVARRLLTLSREGFPIMETVHVGALVKECAELVVKNNFRHVELCVELKDGIWPIEGDEEQLSQVINNLVLNAGQAIGDKGSLHIEVENVELGKGEVDGLLAGRYVKVSVADTGHGIPLKDQPRVFEPFFTTRRNGSGLGLTVCFSIVRKHGGELSFSSTEGEGTVFCVYLPAMPASDASEGGKKGSTGGAKRVLVMDDEQIIREVTAEMLKQLGYECVATERGEDAIREYEGAMKAGRPFGAVILDMAVSSGMGGKDTMQRLKEIDPDVNAALSSGYSKDAAISEYNKMGFKALLSKPYRLSEFEGVVRKLFSRE